MDREFKVLSLLELIEKYEVRCTFDTAESNLVYPSALEYEWVGVVDDNFVRIIISNIMQWFTALDGINRSTDRCEILNKYAIPFMMTANGLSRTTVWFLYQHDNNTWLIRERVQDQLCKK